MVQMTEGDNSGSQGGSTDADCDTSHSTTAVTGGSDAPGVTSQGIAADVWQ